MPAFKKQTHSIHEIRLHCRCCRRSRRFLLPKCRARSKSARLRGAIQMIFQCSLPANRAGGHPPVSDRAGKTFEFPLKKTTNSVPMIRILTAIAASVFAFISASCCCTGEASAPGLRPLPQFQEIQSTPEVHYSK
jgi:hypothetical protein